MTNEEAIKHISVVKSRIRGGDEAYDLQRKEALNIAIEALEKQIPKKPIGRYTDYRCSVCGTRVRSGQGSSSRTRDTVCRKCFTVLDWSDDE